MNRKAMEPISVFPFIALCMLVGVALAISLGAFYGRGYDFRDAEAQTMLRLVKECIFQNNPFASDFDFAVTCNLNKKTLENDHLIYIEKEDGSVKFIGVRDFVNQCQLSDKNKEYPRCKSTDLVSINGKYHIIVGTNQVIRRGLI